MFSFLGKKAKHFDYSLLGADMHSHLIPGVDDGSPDISNSLQLIKGLVELGYKKLVTTPHIMWDMYKNTKQDILERFEILTQAVQEEKIEVELKVAAEYFLDDHVKELLNKSEALLTIHQNMVLVEFSLAYEPFDLKEILFEMQVQDYQPVIAHPERYIYPDKGNLFYDELKDAGYLFQLNILSLIGMYGKQPKKNAHYIAEKNYYDFAGTDLHNPWHLEALHDPSLIPGLKRLLESGKIRNIQV